MDDPRAARIREFLTGLMEHLHVQAVPEIYVSERGYQVVLQGHGLGAIIGRRGETLDAIQQLTNYSVTVSYTHLGRAQRRDLASVKMDHPEQQGLHPALPRGGQIPSFRISCKKLRSSSP